MDQFNRAPEPRQSYPHEGKPLVDRVQGVEGDLCAHRGLQESQYELTMGRLRQLERAVFGESPDDPKPINTAANYGTGQTTVYRG